MPSVIGKVDRRQESRNDCPYGNCYPIWKDPPESNEYAVYKQR